MFLLGWEKGFKGRRDENMCLYRSSLLLLVCGLRANAYENYALLSVLSWIISLAFSTAKTLVSKGLSKKGEKARGFCTKSRGILLAVCMLTVGTCRGREGTAQSHDIACLAGVCSVSRETNCSLFWVNEVGCYCKWPHKEVHASVDKQCSAYWVPECL